MRRLVGLHEHFTANNDSNYTELVASTILTAIVLNLRCFFEFFFASDQKITRPRDGDQFAELCFEDPDVWRKGRPAPYEEWREIASVVNKRVAHFTLQALLVPPPPDFQIRQRVDELLRVWQVFVDLGGLKSTDGITVHMQSTEPGGARTTGTKGRQRTAPVATEDLREKSQHVHYEVSMLMETAEHLSKNVDEPGSVVRNALIESFCVHFRNVYDFLFFDESKHGDDILARDFCDAWRPGQPSKVLDDARKRIGKEIVHLTSKRYQCASDKEWPTHQICRELRPIVDRFAKEAKHLHECWQSQPAPSLAPDDWIQSSTATLAINDGDASQGSTATDHPG